MAITLQKFTGNGIGPRVEVCRARGRRQVRQTRKRARLLPGCEDGPIVCQRELEALPRLVCELAWIMCWWRLRRLLVRAWTRALLRSRRRAEQCVRGIEKTLARDQAETQKTEQEGVRQVLQSTVGILHISRWSTIGWNSTPVRCRWGTIVSNASCWRCPAALGLPSAASSCWRRLLPAQAPAAKKKASARWPGR